MSSSPWLLKPTLSGILVTLPPFVAADADTMAAMFADPELLRLSGSATSTAEATTQSPVARESRSRAYR